MTRPARRTGSHAAVVYERLRLDIMEGRLAAGERLLEQDLSAQFRVSRTPVREALHRLVAERLATAQPRAGVVVAGPGPAEIIEAYVVREALEGLAARLATERASDADRVRLSLILGQLERAIHNGDMDAGLRLTIELHRCVWQMCGNGELARIMEDLEARGQALRRATLRLVGRAEDGLIEHRAIVEAIINHQPDEADARAREHMRRSRDIRVQLSLEERESTATAARA